MGDSGSPQLPFFCCSNYIRFFMIALSLCTATRSQIAYSFPRNILCIRSVHLEFQRLSFVVKRFSNFKYLFLNISIVFFIVYMLLNTSPWLTVSVQGIVRIHQYFQHPCRFKSIFNLLGNHPAFRTMSMHLNQWWIPKIIFYIKIQIINRYQSDYELLIKSCILFQQ